MQGNSVFEGRSHIFGVIADASIISADADPALMMIPFSVFIARLHAANDNICEMDVFWCMADGNPIEACNTFINFQTRKIVVKGPPMIVRDIVAFDGDWPLVNVLPHGKNIRDICPNLFVAEVQAAPDDFDFFRALGMFEDDDNLPDFAI